MQKHDASRLHYDFRLEHDGVMKSWAVTKGPSLVPGEKRLAVQTEDHPIAYNSFEGIIPKDQYGGGTVMVWDRGTWEPEGDPKKGLAKGHLDFVLNGEKLKGRWHLVRMRRRPREKTNSWLLIKAEDEAARSEGDPDILEEADRSVISGRTIPEIATDKDRVWNSNRGDSVHSAEETKPKAAKEGADRVPMKRRRVPKAPTSAEGRQQGQAPRFRAAGSGHARRQAARTARTGCMRSSSTAIGCRPGSTTAR